MDKLPYELTFYILDFNFNYDSNFALINKDFNEYFSLKRKKEKFGKYVNKIRKWYEVNTYRNEYNELLDIEHLYGGDIEYLPKKFIIKYYCKNYPKDYLMEYPEFMAKKLKRNDLHKYILNNMNKINERKKIEVIKFLYLPQISNSDIVYTGW